MTNVYFQEALQIAEIYMVPRGDHLCELNLRQDI